ncbi:MAG: tail fiber protein [Bacteroidales bacterium]|nr:tail fiber protein [Bacteroidales bacterium]
MSDQFELDRLMKSLTPPPDEEAKKKAKALFLQTAEETERTWTEIAQENTSKPQKKNPVFRKSRNAWLHFAAGMAAMLVLTLGILTAYDPTFLLGSVRSGNGLIQYRAFPAEAKDHELDSVKSVAGELVLLKASDEVLEKSGYLPCRGQTLKAADYPALAKILADGAQTFILPDLSDQSPVPGAVWCIVAH